MTMSVGKKSEKCLLNDKKNNIWVSKDEFRIVFPRGYLDCNFFSRSYEYWAMTEDDLKRKREEEPFIPLSSLLEGQSILQKSAIVSHSIDTELFTELMQDNLDISPRMAREDGQQPTKKKKLDSVNFRNTKAHCFICSNICKCTALSSLKRKITNEIFPLHSNELPDLPDVRLIDNFNNISMELLTLDVYKSAYHDRQDSYDENNITDGGNEISIDHVDDEVYEETNDINLETLVYENSQLNIHECTYEATSHEISDLPSTQIIGDISISTEHEDLCEDIKSYFHINNISSIFE